MKTVNSILISFLASLMLLTLGGCISSKPTTSYLLREDDTAPKQYANAVIIDSVQLAGYLERPNPVRRIGRNTVDFYPNMVWAQDIRSMLKETLVNNLLLRNSHSTDAKKYHAIVHFLRLEVDENSKKFIVNAVCYMRCEKENYKKHFVYGYDCAGCTDEKLINFYDKALSELADKLSEMAEGSGK